MSADTEFVEEGCNDAPRMAWEPVTDRDHPAPDRGGRDDEASGFAFNLGEALARLGDRVPSPPPAPRPAVDEAHGARGDLLPPLRESPFRDASPSFGFDRPATAPVERPVAPAPFGHPDGGRAAPPTAPVAPIALLETPVLPDAPPAPPVPMGSRPGGSAAAPLPIVAATRPRKKKKNHLFAKTMLVLLLLGALAAGGLVYGRSYLFPVEWDEDVAFVAEELEGVTGLEFDRPVPVQVLPAPEYGAALVESMLGADWADQLPAWRALGLVAGDPDPAVIADTVAAWTPAWYDPASDEIRRSETVTGAARTAAVTDALAMALFVHEGSTTGAAATGDSVAPATGDSVAPATGAPVGAAVGEGSSLAVPAIADLGSELASGSPSRTMSPGDLAVLPAPIAYELLAVEELGAPLARRGGIEPSVATAADVFTRVGADALTALDDDRRSAPGPQLPPGDVTDGPSRSWGRDAWYLVFAAHLPPETAAAAADAVAADLYTPARRGQEACVYATFTTTGPDAAAVLQLSLAAWAMAAPAESAAVASTLADGTLQLAACDPGPAAGVARGESAAELVARQAARLAAG